MARAVQRQAAQQLAEAIAILREVHQQPRAEMLDAGVQHRGGGTVGVEDDPARVRFHARHRHLFEQVRPQRRLLVELHFVGVELQPGARELADNRVGQRQRLVDDVEDFWRNGGAP